jgi:hypothetical protein
MQASEDVEIELDALSSQGTRQITNGVINYNPTWSEYNLQDEPPRVKYTGEFFVNKYDTTIKIPHGSGRMVWSHDGDTHSKLYDGKWKNGLMHGYGRMIWYDPFLLYSREYKGEWKNGDMDGHGTLVFGPARGDKTTLTCQWVRGKVNGQAAMNNEKRDGTWKTYYGTLNDKLEKNGRGIMTWSDGRKYNGTWKDDTISGIGEYTASNTNVYRGEFKDGDFVKYIWPSGSSFVFDLGLFSKNDTHDYVLNEGMLDLNNAKGTYTQTDKNGLKKKIKGKWSFFDALELGPQRWQTPNYNDEEDNALLGGSKNKIKRQRQSKRCQRQQRRSKRRQRQQRRSKRKCKSKKYICNSSTNLHTNN